MENNLNELFEGFEAAFGIKADPIRILHLIKLFDFETVSKAISYLVVTGVSPVPEGKENNPFGLLFTLCRRASKN